MRIVAHRLCLLLLSCIAASSQQLDTSAWQWQRRVVPAVPAREQCLVLDGDLYGRAAPGLQDVRLLQGGVQVPYVLEESHDEQSEAHPDGASYADRSIFTTVLQIPLRSSGSSAQQQGSEVLPAHVPVERLLFVAQPGSVPSTDARSLAHVRLSAAPRMTVGSTMGGPAEGEIVEANLTAQAPFLLTALGANLQSSAEVAVNVIGADYAQLLLQMRERLLCFQPRSSAPLLLLFGNPAARSPHYSFAQPYRPSVAPLLARFGPTEQNPAFRTTVRQQVRASSHIRLLLLFGLVLTALVLLLPLFSLRR